MKFVKGDTQAFKFKITTKENGCILAMGRAPEE